MELFEAHDGRQLALEKLIHQFVLAMLCLLSPQAMKK